MESFYRLFTDEPKKSLSVSWWGDCQFKVQEIVLCIGAMQSVIHDAHLFFDLLLVDTWIDFWNFRLVFSYMRVETKAQRIPIKFKT